MSEYDKLKDVMRENLQRHKVRESELQAIITELEDAPVAYGLANDVEILQDIIINLKIRLKASLRECNQCGALMPPQEESDGS